MLERKQEVLQGFQSVNIQAEEIKTSILGAQVAGK
jgi:hypothetical protein